MGKITEETKYASLLDAARNEIITLTEKINEYRQLDSNELSQEDWGKKVHEVAGSLHAFVRLFIAFGKFKDKFIDASYYINYEGLQARITSEKTKHVFEFGFDFKGLYLQSYISEQRYLKNMHDDFWQQILDLSKYGDFTFEENAGFSSEVKRKYAHLFKPMKSNIYRLMRNYFMQELLYIDSFTETPSDLGWLTLRWSPDNYSMEEILVMGCEAFKILYSANYSMWKVGDLNQYYEKKKNTKES